MSNVTLFFREFIIIPRFKKSIYVFLSLILSSFPVYGQRALKGVVVDEAQGPVIGATVMIKSTSIGTVTDVDGNFSITPNRSFPLTLTVSYLGYKTQEIIRLQAN